VVNQAIAAEGLGYNSAWLPEHHFGLFGVLPTPAQALTYIAARTSRLRLAPATVRAITRIKRTQSAVFGCAFQPASDPSSLS